jgi:hypothetical protein
MRTIKLKATINYQVNIEHTIEVSEDDNRESLHNMAREFGILDLYNEGNTKPVGVVDQLWIADIDSEGNPQIWVRP